MTKPPIDLLQSTVDVLILRTLAWEPMHGCGMSRFIRQRTEGVLTAEGREQLRAEAATWRTYAEVVFKVLEPV
jgi:hypothetical protein